MFYKVIIYIALAVFVCGLIYKIAGWFRFRIGVNSPDMTVSVRLQAALKGMLAVLFSKKIGELIRVFIMDVVLQARIFRRDRLRWLMHILIFAGFMFLLLTHALDKIIITSLFDRYYLRMNPFLLTAGAMVVAGLVIALYRRYILRVPRLKTNGMDLYVLILLAVIMFSGFALELTKLTSYQHYQKIWYVHISACFFGLAYLPFSKMLHVFTTPASLLANAVMDGKTAPANNMTRQVMELDACTHCGTCSLHCSVAAAFDRIGNPFILPAERMVFLKDYIAHKRVGEKGLAAIQQGIYLCTNCDRCTVGCPAGINLREIWFNVREEMISRGHAVPLMLTPFSFYRGLRQQELETEQYDFPLQKAQAALAGSFGSPPETDGVISLAAASKEFKQSSAFSFLAGTYAYCFTCENCSTVCPVVGNYEDPQANLDLMPHQVIRSLCFGLEQLAMGSRMLWYCLTCYQCQEHCPQGVKVTDILYRLKNLAAGQSNRSPVSSKSDERAV